MSSPIIFRKSLQFYVNELVEGRPYTFVRFGNGEFDCIFRTSERTGSGSQDLTPGALREGMIRATAYSHDRYFKAIQSPGYLKQAALWARVRGYIANRKWYFGDVFHRASVSGSLFPLIEVLRSVKLGIVGPKHLRSLADLFNVQWFVQVRSQDCFQDYTDIRAEILRQPVVDVISVSAGPTAKLLLCDLHRCLQGWTSLIDFGSLWDPYCGVLSRGYHHKMTEEVIGCNLGLQ